jgi:hypothetical protein
LQAQLVPLQHFVPRQRFVQADRLQLPLPLDDEAADPEDELALLPQTPAMHVIPLAVQLEHGAPPVPQTASLLVLWHVMVESQQPPAHEVLSHVVPPLLDADEPLSSPLPLPLDDALLALFPPEPL